MDLEIDNQTRSKDRKEELSDSQSKERLAARQEFSLALQYVEAKGDLGGKECDARPTNTPRPQFSKVLCFPVLWKQYG